MRLHVASDRCTGHGRCYTLAAPDWLEPDDEGYVSVRDAEVEVPEGAEQQAHDAVAFCPENAISVLDRTAAR
ncbi:MAG: hypothetical protein ABS81_10965 [Pseudonocardia sp. SCN 72-86]|nr:MAG: hypothetical protein ABS81_10965 [Pseudonocardia sp. SCN 72-86]